MIANINFVKSVMGELRAKKKFGQNFLIDTNIVEKIARGACDENITTIEIGPGLGGLTEQLLKYSKNVVAYEIDRDMFELLNSNLRDPKLKVILGDFLDVDLSEYSQRVNICSNLPYYVTTPILFKIFESDLDINKITVMVQKEVGDRLCAGVGSQDYGALSIVVQYLYDVKLQMNISRNVFYPQPNVDSVIVSFTPKIKRDREFEKKFFELVKSCFRMRRKTLNNNLRGVFDLDIIDRIYLEMNLDKNIRAEQLSLDDYLNIYRVIYER